MIDHSTAYPIIPGAGQLWSSAHSEDILFIFRSHGHLKGIWSDGRVEGPEALTQIEHGRSGWKRIFPEIKEET